jgi:hypothetical protein
VPITASLVEILNFKQESKEGSKKPRKQSMDPYQLRLGHGCVIQLIKYKRLI